MSDLLDRVRSMKRKMEQHDRDIERRRGELDALYARLEKEYGTRNLAEAHSIREEAEEEARRLREKQQDQEAQLDAIERMVHA